MLPLLIPFGTGILTLFFWKQIAIQRVISSIGMAILLIAGIALLWSVEKNGIQAVQIGNWYAPIGITFVADLFSALMVVLAGCVAFVVTLYSLVSIDRQTVAYGYYPISNFMLMGICGAFLTGDLFNLYVWFEVLLIASFLLLGLGGQPAQLKGTVQYLVINLIASILFLTGLGILYGLIGTLNMADAALQIKTAYATYPALVMMLSMFFLVGFGIKAALFPFFFWMPASYHTPPAAISALFAGLLTKVGVYSLVRVFTLIFVNEPHYTHGTLLLWLAGLSMVIGVFGAMSQMEMRRILAFHSVSQVGYMIMGLALAIRSDGQIVPLALAGTIFYMLHHGIVKSNLFLITGTVRWISGSAELEKLGGLLNTRPYLAAYFFITALSLAGLPPLSGFWAKFSLVKAGLETHSWAIVATALFTGLWTLYSMTKIWQYAFWGKPKEEGMRLPIDYTLREQLGHLGPIAMMVGMTIGLGLSAEPIFRLTLAAANQLLTPSGYIQVVLR